MPTTYSEEQLARNEATDAAWEAFKANPGYGTYIAWVRSGYANYAAALEEQDRGIGSDVDILWNAAKDEGQEQAEKKLRGLFDFTITVVGPELLNVVRGLGSAIVDGVDSAYDTVREKLRGKEPDVIAAITIGFLTILTVRYLYMAVGRSPNGSE